MAPTEELRRDTAIGILKGIRGAAEQAVASGSAVICLTVRRDHPPHGESILLAATGGPRGELLNAVRDGHIWRVTARFRAAAVILWAGKSLAKVLS
jgi:hypothetical protein